MKHGLGPEDKRLRNVISEVLHYLWDPIGVAGTPEARDEYEGYVYGVLALLRSDASEAEILQHLVKIETEEMGLLGQSANSEATVQWLLRWRAFVSR